MAEKHPDIVVGVVSQQKLLNNVGQLHFTPGLCVCVCVCESHNTVSTSCDALYPLKVSACLG